MRIAILDPSHGIAGDMALGALLDLGLDADWLRALPAALGLDGVTVRISDVKRGEIACKKVDFDIPPQPHGRHLKHIAAIVGASRAPEEVQRVAMDAFTQLTDVEASIHGTTREKVHLHEVGAVDAILDIVGSIWGLQQLGVEAVYSLPVTLGEGFVEAAHGRMAVPAPATLRLLEGIAVRPGPEGAGELATPTGAVLVRVLSRGAPPATYRPVRSGYGAGTKDFPGRANALRIVLADWDGVDEAHRATPPGGVVETLAVLACDLDDLSGEFVAGAADALRAAGALDVTLLQTVMKKGRPGVRVEVLCAPADADALEELLLTESSTIGVRRSLVSRRALPRREETVTVDGHPIRLKAVTLPDGSVRAKPEWEDVQAAARALGRPATAVADAARRAGESRGVSAG
ncbi:MAG: nickel pincer cofactor biosynthesis protein LarC [Gemmatimonadetes bacterium]|nr:nickel pincer cofactor biosynthesis protein LarC [Gemmatimonadota bacterium]